MKKNKLFLLLIIVLPFFAIAKAPSQNSVDILFWSALQNKTDIELESFLTGKGIDSDQTKDIIDIHKCIRTQCSKINETLNKSLDHLRIQKHDDLKDYYRSYGISDEKIDLIIKSLNSGRSIETSCENSTLLMRNTIVDQCLLFRN